MLIDKMADYIDNLMNKSYVIGTIIPTFSLWKFPI